MDKSESYMASLEYKECYEGLIKSYDLDKTLFSTYGKVYSLKRSQKDKVKDEDPSAGSHRGLKKRKTSKDAKPTKGPKTKESKSGSSKGTKSQPKSFGKSVQEEEPKFEVADSDMPRDQEGNLGNDDEEPTKKVASKRDWFTKPKQPQESTDPNLNKGKTPQQGLTQSWLMTLAASTNKSLKMLQGALLEKLDWENPEGDDYPFDLTKPLPLVMSGNRQKVPVDYFFNNDLNDSGQEGNFPRLRIEDIEYMLLLVVRNWLTNLSGDDVSDFAIALRMFTRSLVIQKRVKDLQLGVKSYQKKINITKPETTRLGLRKRNPYTLYQDPQGFIYVKNQERNRLMRLDELYKFSDGTLTRLLTSLKDITKNIHMEYLPKKRWSSLEKKRAQIMIKAINKLLKERRMMRILEKFVGGRHYGTDLRRLQRTI
ncbi:hypothetical protein Tco_0173051 [Tanacetum coccineum]